jgi:ATP-dependent Lon protease
MNKRKRHNFKEEEEEEESSDEEYFPDNSYQESKTYLSKSHKLKLDQIEKINKEREITLEKILSTNFDTNEIIWFIEYLQILDNIEKNTEDFYRVKKIIEDKYNNLIKEQNNIKLISKLKQINNLDQKIIDRIIISKHSDYIKSLLYKRYEKYYNNSDLILTEEYYKDIKWIETILDIPTETINIETPNITEEIIKLKNSLDSSLFGMNNVKEAIIEAYCAMRTSDSYQKKIITLLGPPGVGKTSIAQAIATALNLPYQNIDFCTIKDPSVLVGHSQTYIGSSCGLLVNILKETKCLNPVILLDEVDKVSDDNSTLQNILLQILDKTRNNKFTDSYCPEIKIDLSQVFFIIAINDESKINNILRDRMNIIKLNEYNNKEKILIGRQYLLPKILKNLKFQTNDIIWKEPEMEYLINKLPVEAGVRNLEKSIITICEKINVIKHIRSNKKIRLSYNIPSFSIPLIITKNIIDDLLK